MEKKYELDVVLNDIAEIFSDEGVGPDLCIKACKLWETDKDAYLRFVKNVFFED